jgi:hypothetical protein
MKARVSSEKVIVRSEANQASTVVGELHAGDEIALIKRIKHNSQTWIKVTMPDGKSGYVTSDIKVYKFREVILEQNRVYVHNSPEANSIVKLTYNRGDNIILTGKSVINKQRRWYEVRLGMHEVGFIPVETRIRGTAGIVIPRLTSYLAPITRRFEDYGFNYGAAFLAPIWLMTHGKIGIGILLVIYGLISWILFPLFGSAGFVIELVIAICIIAYWGSSGNEIAMKYGGYSSAAETKFREKGWNIAGIIFGVIDVLSFITVFIALIIKSVR